MDEIIHRQCTFNATKLRLVQNIEDDFIKALQHERYASQNASFNGEGNHAKENTIQFKVVRELIRHQLDSFETERLLKPLPVYEEQYVTLDQVIKSVEELLDNDLEHCIDEAFNKLDIRDDHKVMIRVIKSALFSSMKLQKKTQMKQYNKEM